MKKIAVVVAILFCLISPALAAEVTLENALQIQEILQETNSITREFYDVVNYAVDLLYLEQQGIITLTQQQKDALLSQYNALKAELQTKVNELP